MAEKKKANTGLTPRKMEILRAISTFYSSKRYSPTIQELAVMLEKSKATVHEHCAALQKGGFLSTSPGKARSLKLTRQAKRILNENNKAKIKKEPISPEVETGIPLLGKVAAGMPVEAFETSDRLSIAGEFGNQKDVFALEVTGESMIEENICPGDYVICRQAESASNGDLVVAYVDDCETTLKRFYLESDCVRLEPANKAYKPIITQNCKIIAKVQGLIRKI